MPGQVHSGYERTMLRCPEDCELTMKHFCSNLNTWIIPHRGFKVEDLGTAPDPADHSDADL